MKFSGPLESQRLSLLLEMAISREAQMWKARVPKIQPNQVTSHLIRYNKRLSQAWGIFSGIFFSEQLNLLRDKLCCCLGEVNL